MNTNGWPGIVGRVDVFVLMVVRRGRRVLKAVSAVFVAGVSAPDGSVTVSRKRVNDAWDQATPQRPIDKNRKAKN
jgi:hypothetical protein